MNGDLIPRNAVLDALKTEKGAAILGHSHVRYMKAKALVEEIPAVDDVEAFQHLDLMKEAFAMAKSTLAPVVRCKDCKHRRLIGKAPFMFYACKHAYGLIDRTEDNDFCSYGERRADGD